ncbi:phosphatidylinositol N-acetylglucosaminyltransferase subunit GPI1 isoform X2 [Eutrema salsugineum]|uniref:phosphatidylinositol N-acetylglucosaminyltransferase subunit GPI1 isoform X2 n=1 Tax=Eutrema salsugineum TaxID=72664 RepID=UPI000CED39DC|nr:phosphatidylinositol N-acetylglucosaminyltransferase subunit GPI1 isoform X2 [Eutrema salsugineum]
MKRNCRIWFPKLLPSTDDSTHSRMLFGWFVSHSSSCLDVVVAFISDEISLCNGGSRLQDLLHETNEKMPSNLREKTTFTLLGRYDICLNANGISSKITTDKDSFCRYSSLSCGCHKVDGLLEGFRKDSVSSHWIHIVHDSSERRIMEFDSSSRLHHIHWNGDIVSQCDVHVFYDAPVFGSHHFSLSFWNSSPQSKAPVKKPNWVIDLHKRQPLNEMETVILSINCASAAKIAYKKLFTQLETSSRNFSISYLISSLTWWLLATILSSSSSLYYSLIQLFYVLSSFPIFSWVHIASRRILKNTWINFRVRSCQILYWPIFLQENDMTSISCVEHAEKAALQRHSTWSAMAVDLVLGNLIGLGLLFNTGSVCSWIFNFAKEFTNDILRSGCLWLMGVPAGFKLNTELAGVLGMVSLNVIQIWSTLWFFMASFIFYLIRAIAIMGITFGATVSAAFVIDAITFATLHITALHWAITLVYSHQIQALAALWRLFRGRKLNPLRQRLDSYGYTVKQHVVGSLLFTPLLLLLPTTSVFYIFFTITSTTINSICMLIEFTISIIHATPYAEIMMWLFRRKRFPSGVWFEIEHYGKNVLNSSNDDFEDRSNTASNSRREEHNIPEKKPFLMVSNLRSNFLSIGQILLPHYTTMFSGISASSLTTSARGVLSGKRMPSKLGLDLPPSRPWMHMPLRQYWILCHDSIISSAGNG